MAPISASVTPLLALLLGKSSAFVAPTGLRSSSSLRKSHTAPVHTGPASSTSIERLSSTHGAAATAAMRMSSLEGAKEGANDTAEEKAARLREAAASFRAQAQELEEKREQERRAGADRSFVAFDSNKDGAVGISELRDGLEGQLMKSFVTQLTARMGRKPTPTEVSTKIAELPGGSLFPDDLGRKLIDIYDQNGDGLLQQSEFAPLEELRSRLESIFRERREEELETRKAERELEMKKKQLEAEGKAVVSVGETNDGPATAVDKALCAVPYILPLSDGIDYARHLFTTYPQQLDWADPLASALLAFDNLDLGTLAFFFGLSFVAGNQRVNKLLRYNALNAINMDIALIVPGLLGPLFKFSLGQDAYKLKPLTDPVSDVLFIALLVAVAYSIGTSATGKIPNKLPFFGRINRENPDRER